MKTASLRNYLCALGAGFIGALPVQALERLEPESGCYIGMLMADDDSIPRLGTRLGFTPAAFSRFYGFPLTPSTRQSLLAFLDEVRNNGGIAVLTIEPFGGATTRRL